MPIEPTLTQEIFVSAIVHLTQGAALTNRFPHLFEFMDLEWLPLGLRNTMREILECGNAKPFRRYYDFAVDEIVRHADAVAAENIVELGAGTAPLTRRLAQDKRCNANLYICDANPDRDAYRALEQAHGSKIQAIYTPVDFSKPRQWPAKTLLVLSATLHHLPWEVRRNALVAMSQSADAVLIIEPLRRTLSSLLFVIGSAVPAILLPLLFLGRKGTLRRIFWCWLLPAAPLAFLWDGWISCIRQWSDAEYEAEIGGILRRGVTVRHSFFTQVVKVNI